MLILRQKQLKTCVLLGNEAINIRKAQQWFSKFCMGNFNLVDEPHCCHLDWQDKNIYYWSQSKIKVSSHWGINKYNSFDCT